MTKFIYISDSHYGATRGGFRQQKAYASRIQEVVAALDNFIVEDGTISFVLHGGDMIHSASDESIVVAKDLFKLAVPVYLCLGNHDLDQADAASKWLTLSPEFFGGEDVNYAVEFEDFHLHVVPNHWDERSHYWGDKLQAHFKENQIAFLGKNLSLATDLPHILLTHSQAYAATPEQTGMAEPYHPADRVINSQLEKIVSQHKNLRLVLGGHNHLNVLHEYQGTRFVTVSSLVEAPFEFKLITVDSGVIKMETRALGLSVGFEFEYEQDKAFVQGRPIDRNF